MQLPEQPAANNAAQGYKWWELLQTGLATPTSQQQQQEEPPAEGSGSQPVSSVIEAALQAALSDSQWSSSGIPQLLRKALRQSCPEGARKSALALLDFHLLVEKYRNVVSKSSSGGSSGSGEGRRLDSWEVLVRKCQFLSLHQTGIECNSSCTHKLQLRAR